jgi:hypothetical protein
MGRWKWKRRQSVWSFFNICWHAIVIESGWVLKWAFSAKRETSHFHFPLSLRFSLSAGWWIYACLIIIIIIIITTAITTNK